jgi:hypothetical protein
MPWAKVSAVVGVTHTDNLGQASTETQDSKQHRQEIGAHLASVY